MGPPGLLSEREDGPSTEVTKIDGLPSSSGRISTTWPEIITIYSAMAIVLHTAQIAMQIAQDVTSWDKYFESVKR